MLDSEICQVEFTQMHQITPKFVKKAFHHIKLTPELGAQIVLWEPQIL